MHACMHSPSNLQTEMMIAHHFCRTVVALYKFAASPSSLAKLLTAHHRDTSTKWQPQQRRMATSAHVCFHMLTSVYSHLLRLCCRFR